MRPGVCGGERRGGGPHFRNDLLRRIDAKAWHRGESLHRLLMHAEQSREFFIEFSDVRLDHVQFIKDHRE